MKYRDNDWPVVTIGIILSCAAVGILQLLCGDEFTYRLVMYEGAIRNGEAWRVLTSAFIHFDIIHFACNMYSLFQLGLLLEKYLGPVKYTILYIVGIAGSGLLIELVGGEYAAHGGASGAIWALMTAAFLIFLFHGVDVRSMLLVLGVNLVYTFVGGLSWQGHIGGGIAGLLTGGIYILLEKKHNR